ncbi:30S ribosomal protein S6e [Candidatus Pacearchaeota archaeon]|nr:30S ribosomal protein S6e [Candidatus Pacearchaeota archaeon]
MVLKINISEKHGKTYHLDLDSETLIGKHINEKIKGTEISPELSGYEFEITGASDKAGFPFVGDFETIGLRGILLTYGKGMKKRSKREGKKKRSNFTPGGLRLRKKIRGKVISPEAMQINLKVLKEGDKKLSEVFSEQNKKKETPKEEKIIA